MNSRVINSSEYKIVCVLFILCSIVLTSCHTSPINPDKLIGKTREEVLPVLYNNGLRSQYENKFFIITRTLDRKRSKIYRYYESMEDIRHDDMIMHYPNWGFRKRIYDIVPITFFVIPYETTCFLYFENDKVVRYEYSYRYE